MVFEAATVSLDPQFFSSYFRDQYLAQRLATVICFYSVPLGSFVCVCVFVYIHTVKVMVSDTSITTVWPDIIISQILDLSLDILSCFPCCNFCSLFINTYIIQCTYLLTAWSRVLIGKLIASQLVKKFLTFYGTQRFITAFTSTCHLSLS